MSQRSARYDHLLMGDTHQDIDAALELGELGGLCPEGSGMWLDVIRHPTRAGATLALGIGSKVRYVRLNASETHALGAALSTPDE